MVFFLDDYILASYFLLFYKMWGFPNKGCGKKHTRNLRISTFYDITHETVVKPTKDFRILRNCFIKNTFFSFICIIGYKLTKHTIFPKILIAWKKNGETTEIVLKLAKYESFSFILLYLCIFLF